VNPATDEVPQILVQGVLQYQDDPNRESYTGIAVTLRKTLWRLSIATLSQSYIKEICQGNAPSEKFDFWHSESFDLRQQGDRREILRLIIGTMRYLAAQVKD
jgi:hypothetical protein